MKVGIVHTTYLQRGGEDVMVEQEYQLLKNNQLPVSIFYFKNAGGKLQQFTGFLGSLFNIKSGKLISDWISKEKPDVIHLHNWHYTASPSVIRTAKKRGIPVVHTLHNFRLLCPSGTMLHNNKMFMQALDVSFPWRAVFNKVYHNSYFQTFWLAFTVWIHKVAGTWQSIDKYIVLTDSARHLFGTSALGFRESQLAVKSNFIADVNVKSTERQNHFLFVGRLSEEKGIGILLQAFDKSPYQLTIIGNGPLQPLVQQYTSRCKNIRQLGFQNKPAIIEELRRCNAFIFPSVWYEGCPLTIIEALACSTPVIASRMGAMRSMIQDGHNGLHFTPNNVNDLKEKIAQWQSLSFEQKEEYRHNARASYLQHYTPEKNFEQLLFIYKSVVSHEQVKPSEYIS